MNGVVVHLLFSAGVHHESASHGVERVRDDTRKDSDGLSKSPHDEKIGVLGIREEYGLASVVATEVRSAVGNDTDDGDAKASVETLWTVLG